MFAAMTREQRRLVEAMRATTTEFATFARSRDEFIGGMQWLTVKGNEYLTRYRRDPVTGEQKSISLGRRSPETEALYKRFITGRADLDREVEEIKPALTEQTRMAKALRLSRTPSEIADVARAIGLSDLIDHVSIVGEAAVYGYECELAALLPRELLPSDGIDLLVAGLAPEDDRGGGEAVRWALEQPPLRTIFIDRQGRAAPVSLPDPRAWCILRYMAVDLGEMSVGARETSLELNSTMVRLVKERWPEPFDEAHVMSFGHLAEALEGEFRPPPRI